MTDEVRMVSPTGGEKGAKPEVFDQFPIESLMEVARVFGYGAEKYKAHNFRQGYDWSLSFNALMRHALAFWGGEDHDEESGRHHLAHAAWHCLALMAWQREHPEYDDRYVPKVPKEDRRNIFDYFIRDGGVPEEALTDEQVWALDERDALQEAIENDPLNTYIALTVPTGLGVVVNRED